MEANVAALGLVVDAYFEASVGGVGHFGNAEYGTQHFVNGAAGRVLAYFHLFFYPALGAVVAGALYA
jgi:hypothetical protein